MCMCLSVYTYVHVCASAHGGSKGGTRLPEAGVTGSCEPLDVVLTIGPSLRLSEMFKVHVWVLSDNGGTTGPI